MNVSLLAAFQSKCNPFLMK